MIQLLTINIIHSETVVNRLHHYCRLLDSLGYHIRCLPIIYRVVYLPPRSGPITGTLANGFDELWLLEEDVAFPVLEDFVVAFPDDDVALPPLSPPMSCPITGTLANGFDEL